MGYVYRVWDSWTSNNYFFESKSLAKSFVKEAVRKCRDHDYPEAEDCFFIEKEAVRTSIHYSLRDIYY